MLGGHNGLPPALTGTAETAPGGTDAFVTLMNTALTSLWLSSDFGGEAPEYALWRGC